MKTILLVLLGAFALVGAAAAQETVTFGASVQLTGPTANTGRYYRDGYQFTIDKLNASGGVEIGGKRYQLALKLLDNQSDVNLSVRQYVQLITDDKVNFLLGPFASNFALADSSIAEKYEVPMIQGGGASDEIFGRGYKYVFGTLAPATQYFASTIDAMKQLKPEPKKVALLFADDSFDVSVAKGTRELLKKDGFDVVLDERYTTNTSDFSSLLSKVKSVGPDAILVAGHETEILNFIREAKSLDVSPKMYSFTVGVPSADFRSALGKDANYAFGMSQWLPNAKLKDKYFGDAAAFAKAWQAKFGYEPDYHCASAVADVEAFVAALSKAGTLDPKKVRDAIAGLDFESLYGHIRFSQNGQINLPQTMIQVLNGEVVAIYDTKFVRKPVYPMPAWNKR